MPRMMLVGADLVAVNAVMADAGYEPPPGFVAIGSNTARVGDVFDPVTGQFTTPGIPLEQRRAQQVQAIEARKQALLAQGAPYGGRRVELDDATRANLSGMAIVALMVQSGLLSAWPENYARGWICLDNQRVPLPTPQDGIALAMAAAGWYAGLVQFARDGKDAVLTAEDPDAAAAALDWTAWEPPAAPAES